MNAEAKTSAQPRWRILEDTTSQVAGYSVPWDNHLPYWDEQVLSPAECDEVYHAVIAKYNEKQLARVYQWNGQGDELNFAARYTHYYSHTVLPEHLNVEKRFAEAVNRASKQWWAKTATPVYHSQVLGYEEKCQFATHCDNSIWADGSWKQNDPLRELTTLLYISDCVPTATRPNQYSGGELVLPNIVDNNNQPVTITPRKGQMIVFPSHPVFRHQVLSVSRGYRVALVNWWTLR
jgi:predicted 2-oxoglutarate/Fe(II)-dependent dioxygenase YbiX